MELKIGSHRSPYWILHTIGLAGRKLYTLFITRNIRLSYFSRVMTFTMMVLRKEYLICARTWKISAESSTLGWAKGIFVWS
jgi:hypothetical protein